MRATDWIDPTTHLLGPAFPLPCDAAFDRGEARRAGVSDEQLRTLVRHGVLRRVLTGVYAASQAPDSLASRATPSAW